MAAAGHQSLRIGDVAPDFASDSSKGEIKFHEWKKDSWAILFSHPRDYTPVCTTELGQLAKNMPEFEKRGVKVAGLSVDSAESHKGWVSDIEDTQQTKVDYPIIADPERKIANLYGMLDQTELSETGMPLTVRAVFFIDPNNKIRLMLIYPATCGRNFDEILRVIDSMQLTDKHSVTTPANWKQGNDLIVAPSVSTDDAKAKFGDVNVIRPYLRTIKADQLPSN